jgi:hypothetical protein
VLSEGSDADSVKRSNAASVWFPLHGREPTGKDKDPSENVASLQRLATFSNSFIAKGGELDSKNSLHVP